MMGELNNEMREQAKPVIIHTLRIIGDMADNVLNEVTHTKKLCYGCSKEYIDIALWIFPGYVHDNSMCEELFAFFHTGTVVVILMYQNQFFLYKLAVILITKLGNVSNESYLYGTF